MVPFFFVVFVLLDAESKVFMASCWIGESIHLDSAGFGCYNVDNCKNKYLWSSSGDWVPLAAGNDTFTVAMFYMKPTKSTDLT